DQAAEQHFREATRFFAEWGATAKVARLAGESPTAREAGRVPTTAGTALATLDLSIVLQAAQTLSSELVVERQIEQRMRISVRAASAERAVLVLHDHGSIVRATANAEGEVALEETELSARTALPRPFLADVLERGELVVIGDASSDQRLARDPYVAS